MVSTKNKRAALVLLTALATTMMGTIVLVQAATNLVPNPSFENNTGIPTSLDLLILAQPWTMVNSCDYYHTLATAASSVSVPGNTFGNQLPRTGLAYGGFIARSPIPYREYLQIQLSSPLVQGQTYQVSFYVSLAELSKVAVDKIGAFLSTTPAGPVTSAGNLPYVPQIENPTGNYITDKAGWTLITGTYVSMSGGEEYLIIGNFYDNASTTTVTAVGGSLQTVYYYIDDVSVTLAALPCTLLETCEADLGDAPDSTNHIGTTMSTYAIGAFPTVYDPNLAGNAPQGPLHRFASAFAYLGANVTFEGEADLGLDADGVTNLVPSASPPTFDHDLGDDGVTSAVLPNCGLTLLPFSATNVLTVPATAYINVWFDWNRDGDWDDIPRCAVAPNIDAIAAEWAVQNHAVTLSPGFNPSLTTPIFRSINPPPGNPVWMRITLTDVPIHEGAHGGPFPNPSDQGKGGSGPVVGYDYGETEDYLLPGIISPVTCDPAIRTTITPDPVRPGTQQVTTIHVMNIGSASCDGGASGQTRVTTMLPPGSSLVSTSPPEWHCEGSPLVTCDYELPLAGNGGAATLTLTTSVSAPPGAITQCATVSHPEDTDPDNDQSCVTSRVVNRPAVATDVAIVTVEAKAPGSASPILIPVPVRFSWSAPFSPVNGTLITSFEILPPTDARVNLVAPADVVVGSQAFKFLGWELEGAISGNRRLRIQAETDMTVVARYEPNCPFVLSPNGQAFGTSGGLGNVNVTVPKGCSWTATSSDPWITILAGESGEGNGAVSYQVSPNLTTSSRTGTLIIADQEVTITQDGLNCTFSLSYPGILIKASGQSYFVGVTAPNGCAWTVVSNDPWIIITSGSSGTGSGTVNYTVAPNTGPLRKGTATIAGKTFTVTQYGAPIR